MAIKAKIKATTLGPLFMDFLLVWLSIHKKTKFVEESKKNRRNWPRKNRRKSSWCCAKNGCFFARLLSFVLLFPKEGENMLLWRWGDPPTFCQIRPWGGRRKKFGWCPYGIFISNAALNFFETPFFGSVLKVDHSLRGITDNIQFACSRILFVGCNISRGRDSWVFMTTRSSQI